MLLSVFLIALDQTILAPALPVIASKFNALEQIAWIASAYFLTQVGSHACSLQPRSLNNLQTCPDRPPTALRTSSNSIRPEMDLSYRHRLI